MEMDKISTESFHIGQEGQLQATKYRDKLIATKSPDENTAN